MHGQQNVKKLFQYLLVIIYKLFHKFINQFTVFGENILMNVWVTEKFD